MNIFDKLKSMGDIEIPLTVVVMLIAITVVMAYQPEKEVHYVVFDPKSQKIHSI